MNVRYGDESTRRRVQRVLHRDARASIRVVGVLAKVRVHRRRRDADAATRTVGRRARAAAAAPPPRLPARLQEARLIRRLAFYSQRRHRRRPSSSSRTIVVGRTALVELSLSIVSRAQFARRINVESEKKKRRRTQRNDTPLRVLFAHECADLLGARDRQNELIGAARQRDVFLAVGVDTDT
jgi:hypothetical protein